MLKRLFILSVLLSVASVAVAENEKKSVTVPYPKTIHGFMKSAEYSYKVVGKKLLKPGSSLPDGSRVSKDDPACLMAVQVQTEKEYSGPAPFNNSFNCNAPKGICPEPLKCAAEDNVNEVWAVAPPFLAGQMQSRTLSVRNAEIPPI